MIGERYGHRASIPRTLCNAAWKSFSRVSMVSETSFSILDSSTSPDALVAPVVAGVVPWLALVDTASAAAGVVDCCDNLGMADMAGSAGAAATVDFGAALPVTLACCGGEKACFGTGD